MRNSIPKLFWKCSWYVISYREKDVVKNLVESIFQFFVNFFASYFFFKFLAGVVIFFKFRKFAISFDSVDVIKILYAVFITVSTVTSCSRCLTGHPGHQKVIHSTWIKKKKHSINYKKPGGGVEWFIYILLRIETSSSHLKAIDFAKKKICWTPWRRNLEFFECFWAIWDSNFVPESGFKTGYVVIYWQKIFAGFVLFEYWEFL